MKQLRHCHPMYK